MLYCLFTNLSIAENLFISNFPLVGKTPFLNKARLHAKAQEYLKMVDLDLSPATTVDKLSPGERQLVEVAKALSQDASIIIFDEPTTSLTNRETERLFGIINRLHVAGKTILYISHILRDVLQLADEIVVLRDGEVVQAGPKKDFSIQKMALPHNLLCQLDLSHPPAPFSPRNGERRGEKRHFKPFFLPLPVSGRGPGG